MTFLRSVLDAPSRWSALDGVGRRVGPRVQQALPTRVADVLHGRPLGHPLHPALAQVPVGAALSAAVLDVASVLVPGRSGDGFRRSARTLTGTAVLSSLPAAAAGLADYSDLHQEQQRTATVHAVGNATALALWVASLLSRRRGRLLATIGTAVAGMSAALGGHLAHRWAAGTHHAQHVPHSAPEGWYELCRVDDLADRRPHPARIGPVGVVVVEVDGEVHALANACSHLFGPLHEGHVEVVRGRSCLVCPWHGSAFALDDGDVARGPAVTPQPVVEVQVRDGAVWGAVTRLPGVQGRPPVPGARPAPPGRV
jgi:nitrite reductase/ring-hydroxylating ferredoxin subunit/uncharacterized membrane protein